jgi:hypothetical protein
MQGLGASAPLTTFAFPYAMRLVLEGPITLEQPVYLPGNERQGLWGSLLLETVVGPEPKRHRDAAPENADGPSLRNDLEVAVFVAGALRRSHVELPQGYLISASSSS